MGYALFARHVAGDFDAPSRDRPTIQGKPPGFWGPSELPCPCIAPLPGGTIWPCRGLFQKSSDLGNHLDSVAGDEYRPYKETANEVWKLWNDAAAWPSWACVDFAGFRGFLLDAPAQGDRVVTVGKRVPRNKEEEKWWE